MPLIRAIPTTIEKYVVVYYVEVYASSNGSIIYKNPLFQQPKHNETIPKNEPNI
jgi:hypothetical protein